MLKLDCLGPEWTQVWLKSAEDTTLTHPGREARKPGSSDFVWVVLSSPTSSCLEGLTAFSGHLSFQGL